MDVEAAARRWAETWERAFHSHGAHLTDRTDAFNLRFPNPTDIVAHPRTLPEWTRVQAAWSIS